MRRRITRALLAATAAGATITTLGFTAATSAGAAVMGPATGAGHRLHAPSAPSIATPPCRAAIGYNPPQSNPNLDGGGCAGYVASGRDFRYAQAIIRIPSINVNQANTSTIDVTDPILSIGLTSPDATASAGIISCDTAVHVFSVTCTAGTWIGLMLMANNALGTVIPRTIPLTGVSPGDGVKFAIYYNQVGNAVHMSATAPSGAILGSFAFFAGGAVFNHAAALADWSGCPTPAVNPPAALQCANADSMTATPVPGAVPGGTQKRVTQFQAGGFTTASGQRGSFVGPWTLNSVLSTSNGQLPPLGTVQVTPEFLWTDGLPSTMPSDAFGVWWR
jgi:hypothetical protein